MKGLLSNRLITMDEYIASLFIYAWENGIDERVVIWTAAGMGGNPHAYRELRKLEAASA